MWGVCEIPRCSFSCFLCIFCSLPPSAWGLSQWEAGISLGLGVWNTLRLVILPQAVRRMLPPLTSQLVSLIKDTSLVSAIAVADLTMQAQVLIADTFLAFEIWLIVAALYLALTLCVALPARWMERRYAWR